MTDKPLVERLLDACTNRVSGVSVCQYHQIGHRCLTCQAADVIQRYAKHFEKGASDPDTETLCPHGWSEHCVHCDGDSEEIVPDRHDPDTCVDMHCSLCFTDASDRASDKQEHGEDGTLIGPGLEEYDCLCGKTFASDEERAAHIAAASERHGT